uniref:Uncharacterized protein n=1 Tax=Arundo donax TaxID=35708 RepID=A0A0A9GRU2_ARUDO
MQKEHDRSVKVADMNHDEGTSVAEKKSCTKSLNVHIEYHL